MKHIFGQIRIIVHLFIIFWGGILRAPLTLPLTLPLSRGVNGTLIEKIIGILRAQLVLH